ncbi:LysR family transcriptional regulator [Actinomadura roseirufa]|uniref:LysR family transcriptional regulator n=1 Tax=Actinomadura roseirufa TaxID=2094049 RepID=UPI001041012F|nr:LysR family transcriptional regulator [Actinomadura roseirufa]
MNTEAVRAFVRVAEEEQFQYAALTLGISQQAVSKRVAALERFLGVALFDRGPRRTELTVDGRAFLPHARALLAAADRAVQSVRPGTRRLRVDVLGRRLAAAELLRRFHEARPGVELDVVALGGSRGALAALREGTIDAAFTCLRNPDALPAALRHVRVHDEPIEVLAGPRHPLAASRTVRMADLRPHRLWVPGIVAGTEWAAFYESLAATFGLDIDSTGPNFGLEHLLDVISDSGTVATLVGAGTRVAWPAHYELRRVRLAEPVPLYPWSLVWHDPAPNPGLDELREHLTAEYPCRPESAWVPPWAS